MNLKQLNKAFIYFILFNCFWIGCRMAYTGTHAYIFLCWNLILAYIPFGISYVLYYYNISHKLKLVICLLVWVLFLPNAPYIITDFLHLDEHKVVPKWFDILILFSSSLCGLLLGIVSIVIVYQHLLRYWRKSIIHVFMCTVLFLCGFGVFLGRYLRWNSWDIITNPLALLQESIYYITHPMQYPKMCIIILFLGCLQWIVLYCINIMIAKSHLKESHLKRSEYFISPE